MNKTNEGIADFWRWFLAHRGELDVLTDAASPFWDVALDQIKAVEKGLWFELSQPDGGDRKFIRGFEGSGRTSAQSVVVKTREIVASDGCFYDALNGRTQATLENGTSWNYR